MIAQGAVALVREFERFLLPNTCLSCARLVDSHSPDDVMCGVCRVRTVALRGGCGRCAQPLPPVGLDDRLQPRRRVILGPVARRPTGHMGGQQRIAQR